MCLTGLTIEPDEDAERDSSILKCWLIFKVALHFVFHRQTENDVEVEEIAHDVEEIFQTIPITGRSNGLYISTVYQIYMFVYPIYSFVDSKSKESQTLTDGKRCRSRGDSARRRKNIPKYSNNYRLVDQTLCVYLLLSNLYVRISKE